MTYRKRRNTDLYIYLVKDLKTGLLRQATEEEKVGKINKTVKNKAAAGGRKKKGKKKKMKGGDLHVASDQEINKIKNPKNITYEPRKNTDINKPIPLALTALDDGPQETGTEKTSTEKTSTEETGTEETVPKEPINQADALIQSKNKNQLVEQTALEQTALDLAKADQAKADQAKADQAKADQAKADQAKADLAKADQAKADLAKADQAKADQAKADLAKANLAKADLKLEEAERKMEAVMVAEEKEQSTKLAPPTELAKKNITLENIELKPTEPNSKNIKNWVFDYSELISAVKRNTISQVININEQSNLNNELNKINDSDDSDEIKKNKIEENIRNRLDKGIQKKGIKNVAIEIVLPTKEINGKITFKEKTSGGKTVKKKKKKKNKTVKKRRRKTRR